jgi:hypothetical protein
MAGMDGRMAVRMTMIVIVIVRMAAGGGMGMRAAQEKSPVSAQYTPSHSKAQTGSTSSTRSQAGQPSTLLLRKKVLIARTVHP